MPSLSDVVIANMALGHLGVGREIANLDTENSAEAKACRRFFDSARERAIRDADWSFATKLADLTLVEEDPNDEWGYSYAYPSDCEFLRRILSGSRQDTFDTRTPFRLVESGSGLVIMTDMPDAQCEYGMRATTVQRYPVDFRLALSWLLAHYISPSIAGADPAKLGIRALQNYNYEIMNAVANNRNERGHDPRPESEVIRGR